MPECHIKTEAQKPKIPFRSVHHELDAIDAKAAAWIIKNRTRGRDRNRLNTLAYQAMKFTADARSRNLQFVQLK